MDAKWCPSRKDPQRRPPERLPCSLSPQFPGRSEQTERYCPKERSLQEESMDAKWRPSRNDPQRGPPEWLLCSLSPEFPKPSGMTARLPHEDLDGSCPLFVDWQVPGRSDLRPSRNDPQSRPPEQLPCSVSTEFPEPSGMTIRLPQGDPERSCLLFVD
jgi:hypothetical protein